MDAAAPLRRIRIDAEAIVGVQMPRVCISIVHLQPLANLVIHYEVPNCLFKRLVVLTWRRDMEANEKGLRPHIPYNSNPWVFYYIIKQLLVQDSSQ